MPYAAIMVYVDTSSHAAARVGLACDIAAEHSATVIGVSASVPLMPVAAPSRFGPLAGATNLAQEEGAEADLRCAERCFRQVVSQRGCRWEWRSSLDNPGHFLVHEARAADLIVVGQKMWDLSPQHRADPAEILREVGRPILMVPPSTTISPVGTNAVVAWKDSREARRAVLDALPLLAMSKVVWVVDVVPETLRETVRSQVSDVTAFLGRHGIKAQAMIEPDDDGPLIEGLLAVASQKQAGLIVMGGQSHARLHEWTFGSATHTMLKKSPVCLLLSN
ncbi:hypothetical protein GCM10007874_15460 [Labrys miyagiensis]|uniref:Universal stress protein n=1 Tax=Labrys miyagiensis TaxID=346912 RepID=A0ABQ6CFF6_9HYPH|nr:universal stress protein [Labrys miyagiensis]GLS18529.1 hypothetical protein GCM10007874_15460 [Labrys miyagiensis]